MRFSTNHKLLSDATFCGNSKNMLVLMAVTRSITPLWIATINKHNFSQVYFKAFFLFHLFASIHLIINQFKLSSYRNYHRTASMRNCLIRFQQHYTAIVLLEQLPHSRMVALPTASACC